MTDRLDFEARLAERLGAHAADVVRRFDAAAISASAAREAGSRSGWTFPRAGIAGARHLVPTIVWLAIVALLLALVGASLISGGRPTLPAVVEPSASTGTSPSPDPLAVLPGEPWIVYAMPGGHAPHGGLFLVREDGSNAHEILQSTGVGVHRDHPDWSPDGSQLAFDEWTPDTTHAGAERIQIWISDADGSNPRQVTQCRSPCLQRSYPAWSRDGTQLAFIRYDSVGDTTWGPSAIEILDVATGGIRIVSQTKDGTTAYYAPRWSSDGTRIVFGVETYADASETATLTTSLAIVKADGSDGADPRRLVTPDLVVKNPDWHPIDDRIVFEARSATAGADRTDLYVIRADGTGLARLTSISAGTLSAEEPTWTPDGGRILFSKVDGSGAGVATFILGDGSTSIPVGSDLAAAPRLRPTP